MCTETERDKANVANSEKLVNLGKAYMDIIALVSQLFCTCDMFQIKKWGAVYVYYSLLSFLLRSSLTLRLLSPQENSMCHTTHLLPYRCIWKILNTNSWTVYAFPTSCSFLKTDVSYCAVHTMYMIRLLGLLTSEWKTCPPGTIALTLVAGQMRFSLFCGHRAHWMCFLSWPTFAHAVFSSCLLPRDKGQPPPADQVPQWVLRRREVPVLPAELQGGPGMYSLGSM